MCFTSDEVFSSIEEAEKHSLSIALNDILVWKKLDVFDGDKLLSPYTCHRYHFGEMKSAIIQPLFYRAFREISKFVVQIDRGLHSYTNVYTASCHWQYATCFPAIIPKGTKYARNSNGESVSEALIVFKDIESLEVLYKDYIKLE